MRPTSAEAEWAMQRIVVDRLGDEARAIVVEGLHARSCDPPNIRRLRVGGPREAMATLERSLAPVADGIAPPLGIIARMGVAVRSKVEPGRAMAEDSVEPRRRAQ